MTPYDPDDHEIPVRFPGVVVVVVMVIAWIIAAIIILAAGSRFASSSMAYQTLTAEDE